MTCCRPAEDMLTQLGGSPGIYQHLAFNHRYMHYQVVPMYFVHETMQVPTSEGRQIAYKSGFHLGGEEASSPQDSSAFPLENLCVPILFT